MFNKISLLNIYRKTMADENTNKITFKLSELIDKINEEKN